MLVKEKAERLPTNVNKKETSVGSKTVSDKGEAAKDIEKETVIEKEFEKNVSVDKTNEPKLAHKNKTHDMKEVKT